MGTTTGPVPGSPARPTVGLTVALDEGREACAAAVRGFTGAVDDLDELALLGASRCHGWSRLDVVVHLLDGWSELLGALVSPVDAAPTVDAASYWTAFADGPGGDDPVDRVLALRRRTASYARPDGARRHLHDVAQAVQRGVAGLGGSAVAFQGHVLDPGDLLATWAVEGAVHQLDLLTERPAPATALRLGRRTVEALLGEPLPVEADDLEAVLVGTGRVPATGSLAVLADRLPALS